MAGNREPQGPDELSNPPTPWNGGRKKMVTAAQQLQELKAANDHLSLDEEPTLQKEQSSADDL